MSAEGASGTPKNEDLVVISIRFDCDTPFLCSCLSIHIAMRILIPCEDCAEFKKGTLRRTFDFAISFSFSGETVLARMREANVRLRLI